MIDIISANPGPKWFRVVDQVLDRIASMFQAVSGGFLAIMVVINLGNIILRNLGQPSLLWVSPWTGLLMVWSVFLAFYVMYHRNLDIVLMIVIERFGQIGLKFSRLLTALAGLLVVGVLLAEAPQIFARQRGAMELIGLTRYWISVPMLASALMLTVHFVFDLIALATGWSRGNHSTNTHANEEVSQW
jgi:TRAP-type C4-dicarboxylate transport system permease small subunit